MTDTIHTTFRNKNLFLTGATGFIGKVCLYKLLKEFPDMGNIYCMVRGRKDQTPQQRLEKEILSSACFDGIKKDLGEKEWARRAKKIVALGGDMMDHKLGFSEADYATLVNNVNVIIHYAATVDFEARLDISVKINVLGSLKILALAQKCKSFDALVHVSTCYVNWPRHGRDTPIREMLYPLPFDPEGMCKYILSLEEHEVLVAQKQLLKQHNFPNTYCLTKNMTEHLLAQKKGKVPMCIVRPSIVGCSLQEPFPGWIDALTAAGAVFLTAGLGVTQDLHGIGSAIADIVPVDFVVNTTLKAVHKTVMSNRVDTPKALTTTAAPTTGAIAEMNAKGPIGAIAVGANVSDAMANIHSINSSPSGASGPSTGGSSTDSNGKDIQIYHSATSGNLNRCTWETTRHATETYWNRYPHPKMVRKSDISLNANYIRFKSIFFVRQVIPYMMINLMAKLPAPVGGPARQKLAKQYRKMLDRVTLLNNAFANFTTFEWVFELDQQRTLDEGLGSNNFNTDTYNINWHSYITLYNYGLIVYILKTKGDTGRALPPLPPSGSETFKKASL